MTCPACACRAAKALNYRPCTHAVPRKPSIIVCARKRGGSAIVVVGVTVRPSGESALCTAALRRADVWVLVDT